MKRDSYISWDTYFMNVAHLSAMRSKDPNTQVGACIVNPKKQIVGVGYNGFPRGINDDDFSWELSEDLLESKYAYVVHAETNAILNGVTKVDNCTLYVTLFPCNECTKQIIQSGITSIVYDSNKYAGLVAVQASKRMLDAAGVKTRQFNAKKISIEQS